MGNCFGSNASERRRRSSRANRQPQQSPPSSAPQQPPPHRHQQQQLMQQLPATAERPPPVPTAAERQSQLDTNEARRQMRTRYDYEARSEHDLSFTINEVLEFLHQQGDDWIWAKKTDGSGTEGFVPMSYIVFLDEDTPKNSDAWIDCARRDAERLLIWPGVASGSYIIRPSSDGSYALSVRCEDPNTLLHTVRHYKVRAGANNTYFITHNRSFVGFSKLVEHYSKTGERLCCALTAPCPRGYQPPVRFKELEVSRRMIVLKERLGGGNFGEVHRGIYNRILDVAVKTLKEGTMRPEQFIAEAKTMHKLTHPKIVQLLGVCTEPDPTIEDSRIYIITELMPNGSLLEFLKRQTPAVLGFSQLIDMLSQVADGMAYLESQHFIHRDLRAANILVGDKLEVKVSDFGLARFIDKTPNDDQQDPEQTYLADEQTKFPVRWTPPEAVYWREFSIKSDVWSFGVLIYETVTYGRQPYKGMTNREVGEFINSHKRLANPHGTPIERPGVEPTYCVKCPQNLYEICLECWRHEASSRPTFSYLKDAFDSFETADVPTGQYLAPDQIAAGANPATARLSEQQVRRQREEQERMFRLDQELNQQRRRNKEEEPVVQRPLPNFPTHRDDAPLVGPGPKRAPVPSYQNVPVKQAPPSNDTAAAAAAAAAAETTKDYRMQPLSPAAATGIRCKPPPPTRSKTPLAAIAQSNNNGAPKVLPSGLVFTAATAVAAAAAAANAQLKTPPPIAPRPKL